MHFDRKEQLFSGTINKITLIFNKVCVSPEMDIMLAAQNWIFCKGFFMWNIHIVLIECSLFMNDLQTNVSISNVCVSCHVTYIFQFECAKYRLRNYLIEMCVWGRLHSNKLIQIYITASMEMISEIHNSWPIIWNRFLRKETFETL